MGARIAPFKRKGLLFSSTDEVLQLFGFKNLLLDTMHLLLVASLLLHSKALVSSSVAPVTSF